MTGHSTRILVAALLLAAPACGTSGPGGNNGNHDMGNGGNGVVDDGEACDDGNQVDDLTCSADCRSYCGDGVADPQLGEACDGADLGGQTCEGLGYGPGTLACQGCAVDASGCAPVCGDGVCQDGEYPACTEDCAVVSVSGGNSTTCAILADGSGRCWGVNNEGRLGAGDAAAGIMYSLIPIRVVIQDASGGPGGLASGWFHTCAIIDDGSVSCWGNNRYGQLGDATTEDRNVPTPVPGLAGVVAVEAGGYSSCALLGDGSAACWGDNQDQVLGRSSLLDMSSSPLAMTGLSAVSEVSVGVGHACALLADGTVRCWGNNYWGQLGDGQPGLNSPDPVEVVGITGAVAVAAGTGSSCAVVGGGAVRCWGQNNGGQLGDGTTADSPVPVDVVGLTEITGVCLGSDTTCAVTAGGAVHCWGWGYYGSLGNGANADSSVPVAVLGIDNAVAVACGEIHACAILADGTVRCWGENEVGALGNGLDVDSNVPVHPLL
jgi:alpha-tubulin suppressor-like RCC1 family protein